MLHVALFVPVRKAVSDVLKVFIDEGVLKDRQFHTRIKWT
ncbi:hypothetical protein ALPO108162_17105 [Alicyclobacillus pomorum]|jgi:hypothetical protein